MEKPGRWWTGRTPIPPVTPLCEMGRGAAFLSAWEEEAGNSISGTDLYGRDWGRRSPPPFPGRAGTSRVWFGLEGARWRGLQQDEQAYESRAKSTQLFPAPRDRGQMWVGTSCKVLECQMPEDPGEGPARASVLTDYWPPACRRARKGGSGCQ